MQVITRYRLSTRAMRASLFVCAFCLVLVATGCKSIDAPNLEKTSTPVSAEAVQATLTAEPTASVVPSAVASSSGASQQSKPAPTNPWPPKIAAFARTFKGQVWFPTSVPKGMSIDSLDVTELEPGTGLVCDMVFYDGKNAIICTQGSPKQRTYAIVSLGKVAWGSDLADVVHEDSADTSTRKMIVYNKNGTLAELSGGVDFATLKAVAASMTPVK